jgi:hypothetical protein
MQGNVESEIDARTSDAVALAIRFRCPIYTYENIMSDAGIVMEDKAEELEEIQDEQEEEGSAIDEYGSYSMDELNVMLQKAVENEEYEKASRIRDEINNRNEK